MLEGYTSQQNAFNYILIRFTRGLRSPRVLYRFPSTTTPKVKSVITHYQHNEATVNIKEIFTYALSF